MSQTHATDIAVAALQHLAGDTEQLSRFVALSGIVPEDIRDAAGEPAFMVAVLDFFLGHEPSLLAFAASANIPPEDIRKARFALAPPGSGEAW